MTTQAEGLRVERPGSNPLEPLAPSPITGCAQGLVELAGERILLAGPVAEELHRNVRRVAPAQIPVLITGETGSGKEWLARAVHSYSAGARRRGPFKVLNCGSIPPSLVEATLFGAERGSYTGAARTTYGVFEQAKGGTVFLDELGELPLAAQAALLRVLDGQPFLRIGGMDEIVPDVRVVAATNRDLSTMVARGCFREDLFYRLSAVSFEVPPLRRRREEIEPLARLFLERANRAFGLAIQRIAPGFLAALEEQPWPGNVRQLRNVIEASAVRCRGSVLHLDDAPPDFPPDENAAPAQRDLEFAGIDPCAADYRTQVRAFETALIVAALRRTGGNQRKAAALLRLPHRTLVNKLRSHEIRKVYPGR